MKLLENYNTYMITCKDKKYPLKLMNIDDSPLCLFYKGNIELINKKSIAIIGCREYSEYGKQVAIDFAYKLSKKDVVIITGGAKGIDSFANIGAITAGKPSIAVLGNSLDYIYPPENKELEEKILENNGLIITEYMNNTHPTKDTFPQRNRIISGLSDGVLVVEAKEKSGTSITVDFALNQGKDIYAIPGNITRNNSKGTNKLIQQGAKLVTNIEEILEDLNNYNH